MAIHVIVVEIFQSEMMVMDRPTNRVPLLRVWLKISDLMTFFGAELSITNSLLFISDEGLEDIMLIFSNKDKATPLNKMPSCT